MTRPARILMTVDAIGGVWTYAVELAHALAPLGYETVLVVLGPGPSPAQRRAAAVIPGLKLIETGLPLDWLASDAGAVHMTAGIVAEMAQQTGADLVQLNQPALAGCARFSAPVVAVLHSCVETWWQAAGEGPQPPNFAWQTGLVRAGLIAADRVVCPTLAFGQTVAAAYDLAAPPIAVHNGRKPLPHARAALHDFAITAGRLWDKGKNVLTLDRAAARLGVPFKAFGPLTAPHGERVRFDHLHTPGNVDESTLANCLVPRPVFASAALYEPFGLAVLEAASAGCPLVLSDIPTFRELWDGAATFVDAMDAEGFACAIEDLIGDTAFRLEQGNKARAAARLYTPDRMASRMAAIYHALTPPATRVAA